MKHSGKLTLLLIFIMLSAQSIAQKSDTAKMSSLMVYGDNFMFSVKEPDGWTGDIDNAAKYDANIIFYKSKSDVEQGGALVQVYNFKKQDEKTEDDLKYDVKHYEKKYSNLKQQDLVVTHQDYKCYAKLVYVKDQFYQYIVYVNPGAKYKSGISVAMNISKRAATADELKAFTEIIASLTMFKG